MHQHRPSMCHLREAATLSAAVLISTAVWPHFAHAQSSATTRLSLTPCTLPGVDASANAQCGTLMVPENRTTNRGRTIGLRVVVLPATGPQRAPDPVFFIAGGPGSSIVAEAGFLARHPSGLRERRDFVLVDQRGTGGSAVLDCPFYGPPDSLQSFLGDFMPLDAVRRCREMFARERDLTQYTTTVAAQDLDDVRSALGAERINLSGGSYGTRASQEYMRRFPNRVRSATLFGLVPPSLHMPQYFARDAQRSLDAVIAECAADVACRAAFPNLQDDARRAFDRLRQSPATVTVPHPRTRQSAT